MIEAFAVAASLLAGAPSLYLGVLTVVAPRARSRALDQRRHSRRPTRFAICVPAHNEQTHIEQTVKALVAQDYRASAFSVHVVADNCDDSTARRATASGAVAHERTDPDRPGKGEALNWLIPRVMSDDNDVIVVIDADTIADPGFLAALDQSFARGAQVAQGFYAVSDPGGSPAIGLRYAAIACRHYLRPLARTKLGGSSGLYGNGMAFRTSLLTGRSWSNHLIEDAEFQMELLLDGHVVTFTPDAVVRAEMPATLESATTQNERWELGRIQLIRQYVPVLAQRAIRGGALPRRAYVDAVADHLTPPLTIQALIDGVAVGVGLLAVTVHPSRRSSLAATIALFSSLGLAAHVLVGLRLVDAPASVYRSLRSTPRLIVWKLILLARVIRRPSTVSWSRTERNPVPTSEA